MLCVCIAASRWGGSAAASPPLTGQALSGTLRGEGRAARSAVRHFGSPGLLQVSEVCLTLEGHCASLQKPTPRGSEGG